MNAEAPNKTQAVDETMERASLALERCDYFDAERLCVRALDRAWGLHDYERMSRICMPLQEARRQVRQLAADTGRCVVLNSTIPRSGVVEPGCYLLEPPLLGIDAHTFRGICVGKRVPAIILTREPLTRKGTWPIVAVGTGPTTPISVRVYVPPLATMPPDAGWFQSVSEMLGDEAIRKLEPGVAAWRVDDLLHALDAVPDHEKLVQLLGETCRQAAGEPPPTRRRRRGFEDDDDADPF